MDAAKALYFIYRTYQELFEKVKNHQKIFRENKNQILRTVDRTKELIGLKRAMKAFNISAQKYYSWKRILEWKESTRKYCKSIYPVQLTNREVNTIKDYLNNFKYKTWNITNVYYQILRDKSAFFSKTTFYKYVNRLKLNRSEPERIKYPIGFRAEAPKKALHMDVTIFRPLDHSKLYIYFLVDNYSRYILNYKVSHRYSADITFENIQEAYYNYSLGEVIPCVDLITDGGIENKGKAEKFINRHDINLNKQIAQLDIRFSNSMVEAVNKRMKYDFLFTRNLLNIEQVRQFLKFAVREYNQKPHSSLYGLTPEEAFSGFIPDKDMFKDAIDHARKKRKVINLKQECIFNCKNY